MQCSAIQGSFQSFSRPLKISSSCAVVVFFCWWKCSLQSERYLRITDMNSNVDCWLTWDGWATWSDKGGEVEIQRNLYYYGKFTRGGSALFGSGYYWSRPAKSLMIFWNVNRFNTNKSLFLNKNSIFVIMFWWL